MRPILPLLATCIIALGCMSDEEARALDHYRNMRSELEQHTRTFLEAAVQGDSTTLLRLGTDSAVAQARWVVEHDPLLLPRVLEDMQVTNLNLERCRVGLVFNYGHSQYGPLGGATFVCGRDGQKISALLLGLHLD